MTKSLQPPHGPGLDTVSNRNEYQGYLLGGKGDRWASWLEHCATSQKVAGSIGIFHLHDPEVENSGFGGLEVACWPLVPKFAGSNPAEGVGFFRVKKSLACLPSEGK